MLVSGETGLAVAKELSVSPQTICEWKRQPAFVAEINKLRKESLEAASAKIQSSATKAVETLSELAKEAPNPETRRKAALDILRLSGYEPGSQDTYGRGPETETETETAEGVQDKWHRDATLGGLYSNI